MDRSVTQVPLTIGVYSHFMDHCFAGKVVFPAVEALKVLAGSITVHNLLTPNVALRHITHARFNKFLVLEPDQKNIEVLCNIRSIDHTQVSLSLATRFSTKNGAITRIKEHCTATFSAKTAEPPPNRPPAPVHECSEPAFKVSADSIYRELVPFGPAFHSIKGELGLSRSCALATLKAMPDDPGDPFKTVLGSGFPLDGAFHAGCVWSQRFFGIVAFPIGFEKRIIYKPTVEHRDYTARVIPQYQTHGTLGFDIWIIDDRGDPCETVSGVMMRDVSGGTISPPAWIREGIQ
ncbi:polyketide synthase dehydratase domain-containing protein [Desulfobacter curvatus]|uniref:polyketide synthase dehydratase domain-containing protein n=1 Tax=Desulfobacter curvatus TaxID=2290 RepID=UPI0003670625|nr:polyketide synthase dehydratase domain-containing protein [Desulfobacter curvatus]